MTARAARATHPDGRDRVFFYCPGCSERHQIVVGVWGFNDDFESPTFTPSVLVQGGPDNSVCHSFVTDGRIQYLGDCTHERAGRTVDLPEWSS